VSETRRAFLLTLAGATSFLALPRAALLPQRHIHPPPPPQPAETHMPDAARPPGMNAAQQAALRRNEQEFRAGVQKLYDLTAELRDEVQKTSTAEILSIRMYKKTEQIEKLAKRLKTKAKGGQ
jgi:hypothetical protein